ncbi:MAG: hypothetical protein KKD48_01550 [Nanoarchaeota archaeon]|nr:hypothetical protein [Nanoarchaeota archaeon]
MTRHDWGSFIIGSVVSAIIFLIIYSIWFSPQNIGSFYEKLKSSVQTNTQQIKQQDSLMTSCLNDINQKLNILKQKYDANVWILEYKKFETNEEAKEYLDMWGFSTYTILIFEDIKAINEDYLEFNHLVIVLIKSRADLLEGPIIQTSPLVCVDGKLTESSKKRITL